nr:putative ribonuclease H-like domain-containing protein [Tanacetum cinerariifolium]
METQKPLLKDEDGEEVDVDMYRSMIGSLMCLTSLRPDILFVVCACARYKVISKVSHLHAVKSILKYLKGKPKFGLWYPKDSPFDLVACTDSDYAGASLDRKSTTGGCQFLGCRLISWQCKKQTVIANSITETEYVASLKQFWATVKEKTVNGKGQLQALVDGKKSLLPDGSWVGFTLFERLKINNDKEIAKLQQLVKIMPDEEGVAIDAIPLVVKPPSIVDWKIQKEGKKSYYKIIMADESSNIYLIFSHMLKDFNREDVKTLWKLIKANYGSTRPEGDYERVPWGDLKVMFEPHIKDEVWKMHQRYKLERIIGIKILHKVTTVEVHVNAAKLNLVLLSNLSEKYAR